MSRPRRRAGGDPRGAVAVLPDLLEALARELRAGHTLHRSLELAATDPVIAAIGVGDVLARTSAGRPLVGALDTWAAELSHPDADVVRAVLTVGAGTGGALAGVVERAAATLRDRAALRDEVAALTAQVRTSAVLLGAAPVAFLTLMTGIEPDAVALLVTSPLGRTALIAGLALDGLGYWWMRRLHEGVTR